MAITVTGLSHIAIECSDIEKSQAFYRSIIGLEPYAALGGAVKLRAGPDSFVELFPADSDAAFSRGRLKHFSLTVDSVGQAADTLRQAGLEVRGPFTLNEDTPELPTRVIAFVNGPDGEEVELVEPLRVQ